MGEGVAFIAEHTEADDECFTVIAWETEKDGAWKKAPPIFVGVIDSDSELRSLEEEWKKDKRFNPKEPDLRYGACLKFAEHRGYTVNGHAIGVCPLEFLMQEVVVYGT
jgi:hypothetical protein